MAKHYQKLEDVGFLWKVMERSNPNVSWEARLQQLVRVFECRLFLGLCSLELTTHIILLRIVYNH
jgi:hypothetical protein